MNILLLDAQGLADDHQRQQIHERLLFHMARFAHAVSDVSLHLSKDFPESSGLKASGMIHCSISVHLPDKGVVKINRVAASMEKAVALAVESVEPEVWHRVEKPAWPGGQLLKRAFEILTMDVRGSFLKKQSRLEPDLHPALGDGR